MDKTARSQEIDAKLVESGVLRQQKSPSGEGLWVGGRLKLEVFQSSPAPKNGCDAQRRKGPNH